MSTRRFGYTGRERAPITRQQFNRNRYYDAAIGVGRGVLNIGQGAWDFVNPGTLPDAVGNVYNMVTNSAEAFADDIQAARALADDPIGYIGGRIATVGGTVQVVIRDKVSTPEGQGELAVYVATAVAAPSTIRAVAGRVAVAAPSLAARVSNSYQFANRPWTAVRSMYPPGIAPNMVPLTIRERLAEYYSSLRAQPPSKTADEALSRVRNTLDEIEDLHSGVPKKNPPPPPGQSDGRMYPPLNDFVTRNPDGSISATTRGHQVEIGRDGSILIKNRKTGEIDFQQPGGGQ